MLGKGNILTSHIAEFEKWRESGLLDKSVNTLLRNSRRQPRAARLSRAISANSSGASAVVTSIAHSGGIMNRAMQTPFAPVEPQSSRRFSGAALTIGLHTLVIAVLVIGFASLREPAQETALLTVDLLPVQQAPERLPQSTAPQQPMLIQPSVPVQMPRAPVFDQSEPSPLATAPAVVAMPSPVPAVAASTDAAEQRSALETWEGRVLAEVQRKKRYPYAAMQAGQQDVVTVHVVVDAAGNIVESSIVTSKNFALLDEAALDLLRRCSPLPAPPESALTGNRIAFDLPIAYALKPNASR
jgi:protein TonB